MEFLRAVTAVCLECRFGSGAGLGAGPIDFDELAAFTAEMRRSCRGAEPPPDFLAIEAAVRSLYGEPHLAEPLEGPRFSQALRNALGHEVRRNRWISAHPGQVVDRAELTMTGWLRI
jgi:hypothetical protein